MANPSPRYCGQCGTPNDPNARFCGTCGAALRPVQPAPPAQQAQPPPYAQPAYPPPQAAYPQPAAYAPPPPPPRRRRGRGCMWGCLGLVAGVVLVVGGLILWRTLAPPLSDNLQLGKRQALISQTIPAAGGTLTLDAPGSGVDGMSIQVPPGAYADDAGFDVSVRPIEGHDLGPDFNPLTPLIHVDNGHGFAAEPMRVEIPIQLGADKFAMGFFYDERTGKLEGIPILDLAADRITLLTSHFSDFVISEVSLSELLDVEVDTGFVPGVDDWQFTNYGSIVEPFGHCAGQALSAMWYYYEVRLGAGERALYGRWDNNEVGLGTIDFQWDDSWGYRLASVIQNKQWNTDHGRKALTSLGATGDSTTWYAFSYIMKLTGEPQYVSIGRYVPAPTQADPNRQSRRGHALVAYKITNGKLWVADPNKPGQADRVILFEGGAFKPYASGSDATDIQANGVRLYPEVRYLAKTALVDWDLIRAEYERMREGKAGEGIFPGYTFKYLADVEPTTGKWIWQDLPEVLEIDEETTAKAGEAYRGKLVIGMGMDRASKVQVYEGTTLLQNHSTDAQNIVIAEIGLTPGAMDLGVEVDNLHDNAPEYNDFRRVQVVYERPDLSGTWEGQWRVQDATNAIEYIVDVLTRFVVWIGLTDEATARAAIWAGIKEDPNLYDDHVFAVTLEALDLDKGDRYRAEVLWESSAGELTPYSGEATYRDGVLTVVFRAEGSKIAFTGQLSGSDKLDGTFSLLAWGVVKDAVTGSWELAKQAP